MTTTLLIAHFTVSALTEAQSRGQIISMSPTVFLWLAQPSDPDAHRIEHLARLLDAGGAIDAIPELSIRRVSHHKYQVDMHDGRHRVRVLAGRGVTAMPVLISGDIPKAGTPLCGQADHWRNITHMPGPALWRMEATQDRPNMPVGRGIRPLP
ncbi:hypothetical protein EKL30_04540 [Candidimonas sp. SYP-B2681]|uniref:hypothetical protein n=1 Tax=Candidimonas sp. SYP-B2681 TaxID=2497686 RepID=UPI000F876092|nr:hypothetical protein [Candidimonas sp. SYP-B2681]RTZ48220.1 hypothetical protein EKL30_04540 [Candidimonas sp. SYP-B2681]